MLTLLSDGKPRSLQELSRELELSTSTTFRQLATLVYYRYVRRDEVTNQYQLGLSCLELARAYYEGDDLRRMALPAVVHVYVVGVVGLCYSSSSFNGRPRFLLTAFPLLFPLARLRGRARAAALVAGAAGMIGLIWFLGSQGSIPP